MHSYDDARLVFAVYIELHGEVAYGHAPGDLGDKGRFTAKLTLDLAGNRDPDPQPKNQRHYGQDCHHLDRQSLILFNLLGRRVDILVDQINKTVECGIEIGPGFLRLFLKAGRCAQFALQEQDHHLVGLLIEVLVFFLNRFQMLGYLLKLLLGNGITGSLLERLVNQGVAFLQQLCRLFDLFHELLFGFLQLRRLIGDTQADGALEHDFLFLLNPGDIVDCRRKRYLPLIQSLDLVSGALKLQNTVSGQSTHNNDQNARESEYLGAYLHVFHDVHIDLLGV
ncbi:hypothetical protein OR1_04160 [Geobacter sp. OR-1]|nr:hypothetical protein OR1_04160 [Geobacter sp. OR-1]